MPEIAPGEAANRMSACGQVRDAEEGMVVRNADKMVARLVSEGRIENGLWSMPIGLGTTTGSATPIFFFSHARKTPSTSSRVVVIKRVDLGVQFVPQLICARVRRGLRCTEVRYLCPHMLKAHIVHHEELEKPETIEDADNDSVGIQNDGRDGRCPEDKEILIVAQFAKHKVTIVQKLPSYREAIEHPEE